VISPIVRGLLWLSLTEAKHQRNYKVASAKPKEFSYSTRGSSRPPMLLELLFCKGKQHRQQPPTVRRSAPVWSRASDPLGAPPPAAKPPVSALAPASTRARCLGAVSKHRRDVKQCTFVRELLDTRRQQALPPLAPPRVVQVWSLACWELLHAACARRHRAQLCTRRGRR
jgi:hypothetical protein